jgi:hypothetical protein
VTVLLGKINKALKLKDLSLNLTAPINTKIQGFWLVSAKTLEFIMTIFMPLCQQFLRSFIVQ